MKLEIKGVSKQYDGKIWALRDFTLELAPGVLGLLGPNGAGKSTLMRILSGVEEADEGELFLDGRQIALRSPREPIRSEPVEELTLIGNGPGPAPAIGPPAPVIGPPVGAPAPAPARAPSSSVQIIVGDEIASPGPLH